MKLQIDLRDVRMENINFYEQINLFFEDKRIRKPLACVRMQGLAYVGLIHAYVGMNSARS